MSRKFSAVHEQCTPENYSPLAIRNSLLFYHSPVANCHSLPFHQSLFAIRYSLPFFSRPADLPTSFGSAGASPSQILAD
jgi:hypothetical protein